MIWWIATVVIDSVYYMYLSRKISRLFERYRILKAGIKLWFVSLLSFSIYFYVSPQVMFYFGQNINKLSFLYHINFMDLGRLTFYYFWSIYKFTFCFWCKYIYSRAFNKVFLIKINPIPLPNFMMIKGRN